MTVAPARIDLLRRTYDAFNRRDVDAEIDPHVEPVAIDGDADRVVVTVHRVVRDRQGNAL
jgi:hypothetical protein